MMVPTYTLDGEPVTLDELLQDNAAEGVVPFTEDEVAAIKALGPGEAIKLGGGGAAGWVELRRVD